MNDFALIRDRVNIEDIASRHMSLVRRGRSIKALCPFHSEKTASFMLYPDSNRFFCHGCHVKGDVIDLHQALTGTDKNTAIKQLKHEYGLAEGAKLSEKAQQGIAEREAVKRKRELRDKLNAEYRRIESMTRRIGLGEFMLDTYGELFHERTYLEARLHNLEQDAYTDEEIEDLLSE